MSIYIYIQGSMEGDNNFLVFVHTYQCQGRVRDWCRYIKKIKGKYRIDELYFAAELEAKRISTSTAGR